MIDDGLRRTEVKRLPQSDLVCDGRAVGSLSNSAIENIS